MPTGYTAALYEGEVLTLSEFAATCARGMGAFMHMRDSALDEPLYVASDSTFYATEYARAVKDFSDWIAADEEERYFQWSNYYNEAQDSLAEKLIQNARIKSRYTDMLEQVIRKQVPSELNSFKKFMIDQLEESLQFDTSTDEQIREWYSPKGYVEWCDDRENTLVTLVGRYREEMKHDDERNRTRREYTELLMSHYDIEVQR